MEAVAEQVPAMVGIGKTYLVISAIAGIAVLALVLGGGFYVWKNYNKAIAGQRKNNKSL